MLAHERRRGNTPHPIVFSGKKNFNKEEGDTEGTKAGRIGTYKNFGR